MEMAGAQVVAPNVDARPKVTPLRSFAAFCILAVGVGILCFAMAGQAAHTDFISFWAAGQQIAHHQNPYDGAAIGRLEAGAGAHYDPPLLMRNPPYAFFLVLPLGLLGVKAAVAVWSMAIVAALMASTKLLWALHGRREGRFHLVAYCFPPAFVCLLNGQTGIFLLLGVVLFLYGQSRRPWLAGAGLLLCALKPHLFLSFAVVLLLWMAATRAYRVAAGFAAALAASCGLSFWFDPAAWSQYFDRAGAENIQNQFIPTLSLLLRMAINVRLAWLQFVPAMAACVWAVWYFRRHRAEWSWTRQGSVVLMVSVLAAPYAWFTDQSILFPAVLAGLYLAAESRRPMLIFGCITGAAMLEVLFGVGVNTGFYYVWAGPAWLAWYLYVSRSFHFQRPA
jgi:hypothetical protein